MRSASLLPRFATLSLLVTACGAGAGGASLAKDPATAQRQPIDRFSAAAGMLMVRDPGNALPAADVPIDFDQPPFITRGLGPAGEHVGYYNFDVRPLAPSSIFVLFRDGESTPVEGQLNIVDVVPGDPGYNDFWRVQKVAVPTDYVANTIASYEAIETAGLAIEATDMLVNCPIVPAGSTARLRAGAESAELHQGWYRDKIVTYFTFEEAPLGGTAVPLADIFVTFNVNPDQDGGGPPSGFAMQDDGRTHNVLAALPGQPGYSPLWDVNVYDNADFTSVSDLPSAAGSSVLAEGVATVNCPVVEID